MHLRTCQQDISMKEEVQYFHEESRPVTLLSNISKYLSDEV
jgi:hypothetical protein